VTTLAGAILGLLVVGETVNVSSMIGVVALFGICAQNDILLLGKINDLRREGRSLREAVLEGARVRFRPILMTDLVMIVGVLPLVLRGGTGSELHRRDRLHRRLRGRSAIACLHRPRAVRGDGDALRPSGAPHHVGSIRADPRMSGAVSHGCRFFA
jgi:hypothetical protein